MSVGEVANLTVLLTGFSAFPGTRNNPTEKLVGILHKRRAHFARRGIRLETRVLPVVYDCVAPAVARHADALEPDVILHFGLATRRAWITIETVARNRVSTVCCDAAGRRAARATIRAKGPGFARTRLPAAELAAAVCRSGAACRLSNNAGTYLCNAAFYLSLTAPHARHVGFIHVPRLRSHGAEGLTMPDLLRAAEAIILRAALVARRQRPIASRRPAVSMRSVSAELV